MGAIYLILVVLAITSVALMGKISARRGVPAFDLTCVIFMVATVFGFFFAWSMGTRLAHYTPRLIVISALAGAGGAAAVFVFNLAIRMGHFGFSNAIYRSSFVIPWSMNGLSGRQTGCPDRCRHRGHSRFNISDILVQ